MSLADQFTRFSKWTARTTGHPGAFALALAVILAWVITGPLFHFSDTWQLIINTATTVVTFLMVFLIQSTQNRDSIAVQLKLDELVRATRGAHNSTLALEELTEEELETLKAEYLRLAERARSHIKKRQSSRSAGSENDDHTDMGNSAVSGKAHKKASTA
jgi:low affinity Fe/Cu permease